MASRYPNARSCSPVTACFRAFFLSLLSLLFLSHFPAITSRAFIGLWFSCSTSHLHPSHVITNSQCRHTNQFGFTHSRLGRFGIRRLESLASCATGVYLDLEVDCAKEGKTPGLAKQEQEKKIEPRGKTLEGPHPGMRKTIQSGTQMVWDASWHGSSRGCARWRRGACRSAWTNPIFPPMIKRRQQGALGHPAAAPEDESAPGSGCSRVSRGTEECKDRNTPASFFLKNGRKRGFDSPLFFNSRPLPRRAGMRARARPPRRTHQLNVQRCTILLSLIALLSGQEKRKK